MTGISTLAQSQNHIRILTEQQGLLNKLSTQLASGKKARVFSGLERDILSVQRSRANINSIEKYLVNITNGNRRLDLTRTAIEEFKAQAENLLDFMITFSQQSAHQKGELIYFDNPLTAEIETIPVGYDSAELDLDFRSLTEFARSLQSTFQDLINVQDGDRYLLTGSETTTEPISSTNTLDAAIGALLSDWKAGAITTDDLIADLNDRTTDNGNADAITDTIVGYSTVLSTGSAKDVIMRADDTTEIDYTVLANENPFRDIMVIASYFANENLPPIADEVDPGSLAVLTQGAPGADVDEQKDNFFAVFQNLIQVLSTAVDELDAVRFRIENVRVRVEEKRIALESEKNILISTVSDIEDVDVNEIALALNTISIQLDASYRVTARTQELSLVNFI